MNQFLKDYFYYTKNEMRGIMMLLILLSIISITPLFINSISIENNSNFDDFEAKAALIAAMNDADDFEYAQNAADDSYRNSTAETFYFNPNTASQADFERLGLTSKTAQSIVNYRNKGGKFFKAEDFKKIYTLNESDYERLKTYIDIPKTEKTNTEIAANETKKEDGNTAIAAAPKTDYVKKSTEVKIDINTAKIEDFQQLKGIGAGYANRIVKYRDDLGGFVNINQIQEVYGISKEIFEEIQPQLIQTSKAIQKININTADYQTLVTHPYLDSKRANAIIKYRQQHGDFKSVEDLKNIYAISAKVLEQIKPYLTVK